MHCESRRGLCHSASLRYNTAAKNKLRGGRERGDGERCRGRCSGCGSLLDQTREGQTFSFRIGKVTQSRCVGRLCLLVQRPPPTTHASSCCLLSVHALQSTHYTPFSPITSSTKMSFLGRGSQPSAGGVNQERVDMATQEYVPARQFVRRAGIDFHTGST